MIAIDHNRVTALATEFKDAIELHYTKVSGRLISLRDDKVGPERTYIDRLLQKGVKLVTASLQELALWQQEFNNIMPIDPSVDAERAFKKEIINALGYKELRSKLYPKYFRRLGIKSCVYCNSQLCLTVEKENDDLIAKFQVDHFISKDKFPCLSIALFNLYPVCASCNNIKGVKSVPFRLYTDQLPKESEYRFVLEDPEETLADYIANRNADKIKISFTEPGAGKPMDSVFSISGIYNTQVDVVEELMMKAHIYGETYINELHEKYKSLFPDKTVLKRMVIGNYVEAAEIHNRPMSKFMQDIAKQLKLI